MNYLNSGICKGQPASAFKAPKRIKLKKTFTESESESQDTDELHDSSKKKTRTVDALHRDNSHAIAISPPTQRYPWIAIRV